jgi:hypothetical protein
MFSFFLFPVFCNTLFHFPGHVQFLLNGGTLYEPLGRTRHPVIYPCWARMLFTTHFGGNDGFAERT